jgi:hypothetical protein
MGCLKQKVMSTEVERLKKELAILQAQLAAKQAPRKAKIKNGERHIPMGTSGKALKAVADIPVEELKILYRKKMTSLANQALSYERQAARFQQMADICYAEANRLQQLLS